MVTAGSLISLLLLLVSSSVFALHFTEPPVSAQLLAFLRVFCMTEGKSFQGKGKKKKMLTFFMSPRE